MSPRSRPWLAFLFFLLLFPAIATGVQAWRDGLASLSPWQWPLLGLLPILAWAWWRHFSVLGCRAAHPADPEEPSGCRCRAP